MLTIDPSPACTIRSPIRAESRNGPLKFTATVLSNSSSETSDERGAVGAMPALLISTSTLPKAS